MQYAYGFLDGTTGADGDDVDVILGNYESSSMVFAVEMIDLGPDVDKREDEYKICLGFRSVVDAEDAFLSMYPKTFLGNILEFDSASFRALLKGGRFERMESLQAA